MCYKKYSNSTKHVFALLKNCCGKKKYNLEEKLKASQKLALIYKKM